MRVIRKESGKPMMPAHAQYFWDPIQKELVSKSVSPIRYIELIETYSKEAKQVVIDVRVPVTSSRAVSQLNEDLILQLNECILRYIYQLEDEMNEN